MRGRGVTTAVLVTCAMLAGCSEAGGGGATPSPAEPSPTSSPQLPGTAAGRQAAWVLEQISAEPGTALPDDAADRFSAEFLAQVPVEQLAEIFEQLRAVRPWEVETVESDATSLSARIAGTGQVLQMQLAVDADEVIAGLFFGPAAPEREPAADAAALLEEVGAVPGSSLYVARVVDGECVPVEGLTGGAADGESLPIGSIVKLYVLGAVVDAVERGDLAWDTELTVTDELRSLPSGTLQDEPAGTVVTVEAAATAMIEISDNTATDLLVDAVGREAVEQQLAAMGHADPAANVPLATTRELFHLGWGGGAELRERWRDADEAARRAILAELPPGPPAIDPAEMAQVAAWPYDVDWFATGADLCAAHVALADVAASEAGAPVRDILAANPGIEVDDDAWGHVAFKGGSSVGTMAGAWYAEPVSGDPVVVVIQSAAQDPQATLAPSVLAGIAQDALRLTAD